MNAAYQTDPAADGARENPLRNLLNASGDEDHAARPEDGPVDGPEDGDVTLLPRIVRKAEIINATSQLAIMVDTGIPLASALTGIIRQETNPTLRRILTELRTAVEGGQDFSTALAAYPRLFDKTYVSLVRVSETTGSMGEMLQNIANYLRKQQETRNKVRAAMAYPGVMLVLAVAVTIFLLSYVMPKFTPIFASRGIELPAPTQVLMGVSSALIDHWPWWVAGAVALVAGTVLGIRTDEGRRIWDWVKINLPIIGPAMRKVIISRTVRALGIMTAGGVSVLEAIRLAAEVSGNVHYRQLWLHVLDEITVGSEINAALSGSSLIPPTLVQMIAAGEQTGKLDSVLMRTSEHFDREVETSLKAATSLIEPLMIVVMGGVVGGIGLALLLPIFSLSRPAG